MKKSYIVGILVILAGLGLLASSIKWEIFPTHKNTFYLIQGESQNDICRCFDDTWVDSINNNGVSKIGDYSINLIRSDGAATFTGCKANTCNGAFVKKDSYGCDLWEGISANYWTNCGCAGHVPSRCLCNNPNNAWCGDSTPCYSPAYPENWIYHSGSVQTCGGAITTSEIYSKGCFTKLEVKKGAEIIYKDDIFTKDTPNIQTNDLNIIGMDTHWDITDPYQHITSCRWVGTYIEYIVPENVVTIEAQSESTFYIKGTNVQIGVKVKNNWVNDAIANVSVVACQPTFFGNACSEYSQIKTLSLGENILTYNIPTDYIVDRITITPKIELFMPDGFATGLNIDCNENHAGLERIEDCGKISVGTFYGKSYNVMIIPNPLYLTDRNCNQLACPGGYFCQTNSGLCIRDDLKDLSCMQLGCPVTTDKQYECTSAGICAETVFKYIGCPEKTCPEGSLCDITSGVCIEEHIFNSVVQCNIASDCYKPCNGLVSSCENNRCVYSGKCDVSVIQCFKDSDCEAIAAPCAGISYYCTNDNKCAVRGDCEAAYLLLDCSVKNITCPGGYVCDTSYSPAVCVKTQYEYASCLDTGCPRDYACLPLENSYICQKSSIDIIEKIISYWFWWLGAAIIITILWIKILWIKRRR